jgi:CHAT domain-containing protein/tetratricopeptide (TPR) repeat protein
MIRKIWQTILNLWRQIRQYFDKKPAPPAPTPIRTFGVYEQKFMALLEGVEQGWSRGEIKGFLIGSNIKDGEWENWLQVFGEMLLVSPETNLELGRRMVWLGEINCGKISQVAGNIGRQLLAGESLSRDSAEVRSEISENIVSRLLAREGLSVSSTDNLSAKNQRHSISQSEVIARGISQEALELYKQGVDRDNAGDLEGAIAAYEKALKIYPQFHYAWNNLGIATRGLGRDTEAIAAFDKALKITGNQKWEAWVNRGWTFFQSGSYIEAIENWDEGLQKYLPSNRDYRLVCSTLHQHKGEAHYKHGKQTATYWESFHQAKTSYEQAREFLKSPLIPETYLEVMQGLITVCRSLGEPKTSEYLTEATTVLENLLLDNQTHPKIKQRLQRKFAGLYQLEVDTLVESGKKINALEKAEARKNFCLQWMRAGSPNRTDSPTYLQIRDLLANNTETAIIYWHLSPVSLTAFIVTLEKFEVISTPLCDLFPKDNSQSLEKWLKVWKTNYQKYCKTSKDQSKEYHPWRQSMTAQLQKLADILKIPEICRHLTNIQHLILIPHRDLHLLPLDALFQPHFAALLQDTEPEQIRTISRLPSAQIAILQQQQNPTETVPNSLLMVEHSQGKTALKYTEIEAAAISQFYPTQRPANATTKTAIIQALQANQGIFHYTGHAYHHTEKSEDSALILASGEELTLTDILQLNFVNYYLICLSACETGFTKTGELIDEFVGIASGFLPETNYIISTLWRVDERSSALLMIYFYQLWKQGIQPPAALQQAKDWLRQLTTAKLGEWYATELLPLLKKANFKNIYYFEREASRLQKNSAKIEEKPYDHPYHWEAFTITGNG